MRCSCLHEKMYFEIIRSPLIEKYHIHVIFLFVEFCKTNIITYQTIYKANKQRDKIHTKENTAKYGDLHF